MARSNARAIRTQKKSLDFPFWVVLDSHVVLDYLLDAQEGVCAITNSYCNNPVAPGFIHPTRWN